MAELVTGFGGKPHVTAAQARALILGAIGGGFALKTGKRFAATQPSANKVTVDTGDAIMPDGSHVRIESPETAVIESGSQGMKRSDLVGIKTSIDYGTGVERAALAVVKGAPSAGAASDPSHGGDFLPLYRVRLDGISAATPEKVFSEIGSLSSLAMLVAPAVAGILSFAMKRYKAAVFGSEHFSAISAKRLLVEGTEASAMSSPTGSVELYKADGFSIEAKMPDGAAARVFYDRKSKCLKLANEDGKTVSVALNQGEVWINGDRVQREKVLYTNPGTHDGGHTAPLSERGANFRYLDIFYHDNDGNHASVRVQANDSAKFSLVTAWADNTNGGNMWVKSRVVRLNDRTLATYQQTWNRTGDAQINNSTGATAYYVANITIDRVVGIR